MYLLPREPINVPWTDGIKGENGQEVTVNAIPCDEDFVKTLGLKIIAVLILPKLMSCKWILRIMVKT
jgi:hypothetical protein